MKQLKLNIELVPSTSWYSNVRSNVTRQEWDRLRKKCYENASHVCELCGDVGTNQGFKHKVECHEIWEYDDVNLVQKLTGLIALCPDCHTVKHPGLANLKNRGHVVIRQLMKVNNITANEAGFHVALAFAEWKERSEKTYTLDITFLKTY